MRLAHRRMQKMWTLRNAASAERKTPSEASFIGLALWPIQSAGAAGWGEPIATTYLNRSCWTRSEHCLPTVAGRVSPHGCIRWHCGAWPITFARHNGARCRLGRLATIASPSRRLEVKLSRQTSRQSNVTKIAASPEPLLDCQNLSAAWFSRTTLASCLCWKSRAFSRSLKAPSKHAFTADAACYETS